MEQRYRLSFKIPRTVKVVKWAGREVTLELEPGAAARLTALWALGLGSPVRFRSPRRVGPSAGSTSRVARRGKRAKRGRLVSARLLRRMLRVG